MKVENHKLSDKKSNVSYFYNSWRDTLGQTTLYIYTSIIVVASIMSR